MKRFLGVTLLLALAMLGAGCSSTGSSSTSSSAQPASVFVTGEDAPLAAVVGFNVTINSITLNGNNGSPQVLSTATPVDFARLLGLRSPLAFSTVPADTYNSATFSPTTGTSTQTTVTVNFPAPMVVGSNGLAGLRMEFDIRQSVGVDGSGQITGVVNP